MPGYPAFAPSAQERLPRLEELCDAAQRYDGTAPLDEATWRTLRHEPQAVAQFLVTGQPAPDSDLTRQGPAVGGWAAAALRIGREVHLVVHPDFRRAGRGGSLLRALLDRAPAGELTAWSHGGHPAAARLAAETGFEPVRALWVLRRPDSDLPDLPDLPDLAKLSGTGQPSGEPGVSVIGYDDSWRDEVLRVNAAAFASHPEQGGMDAEDLARRMAQPWFDPAGLLLAVTDPSAAGVPHSLLGFHWTKRHDADHGEVYVVAVDPAAQGRGLGGLLTLAGLHHLFESGARSIHLYVESDNRAALATYSRLGFTHAEQDTHVQYRRLSGHPLASPEDR